MKVLFIQKEGGVFGAEQFHLKTIPFLKQAGIDVHFIRLYTDYQLGKDSPFVHKLQERGIPVYQVNIGRFPGLKDILKIKKIIEKGKFDVVHSHLIHGDFYAALVKTFFIKNMVLVSTKHGYEESYNNDYGFEPASRKKNLYYRICCFTERKVNRSFAISDGLTNFFVKSGISHPSKIERIHYGFDMASFQPTQDIAKYRISKYQLVLAGRMVKFKGHRYALEALKILREKYNCSNVMLLIIGVGELEEELRNKVKELSLTSNVSFLGYRSDVSDFMYHSDAVLIPSIAEGFGVVFLEAINSETPIVAFDVPAGNEILNGSYDNLLVPPFNVEAFASRINDVLKNKEEMDEPVRKAKAKMLAYFTIDRMVGDIVNFYERVLKNN